MRTKLIITGAIGVLAAATLTVNAQTTTQKTTPGSVARLLAASAQVARTDREDITIATRAAATAAAAAQSVKPAVAESEKGEPERSAAPKVTLSASCQAAITAFRSARQAEATEDAKERAAAEAAEGTSQASATTDRSEDATEGQQLMTALTAVRTACVPTVPPACRTAFSGLLPLLQSLRNDELSESRTGTDAFSDGAALRAGFASIAATCLPSE